MPPWELVQTVSVSNDRLDATIHVNPLGAGHLVVVALNIDEAGTVKTIADSGASNQYRLIQAGSVQSMSVDASLWLYYVENSRPGADEILIAATHAISGVVVWEVAGVRTDESLDAAASLNDQPPSKEPLGPQITTSAPGDFVVSVALANGRITRMHPDNEFTFDDDGQGNGWSHLTDSRAPAGLHWAQWDQMSADQTCSGAAAFQIGP